MGWFMFAPLCSDDALDSHSCRGSGGDTVSEQLIELREDGGAGLLFAVVDADSAVHRGVCVDDFTGAAKKLNVAADAAPDLVERAAVTGADDGGLLAVTAFHVFSLGGWLTCQEETSHNTSRLFWEQIENATPPRLC